MRIFAPKTTEPMTTLAIESLNLLMLNVGMAHHDGDWNWQGVSSPFTRIYYVTRGTARLHLPDGVTELRAGHLYMVPAYTMHSYECDGVFEHYYLHVYEGVRNETDVMEMYDFPTEVKAEDGDMELMARMCMRHPEARLPESNPETYDNVGVFTDYVKRYQAMELWEKMELRGATLTLFSRFIRRARLREWVGDERMRRVLTYVHQHICEDISIDTLAELACVTKPYLIRIFKKELGSSPLQYVNQKKVERAQLLLLTEDCTVKEVAWQLGFTDHSYFIRMFRKTAGTTPQGYRQRFST